MPLKAKPAFFDALGLDFVWRTQDGLEDDWRAHGRTTDMGHAEYGRVGADRHAPVTSPFIDVHEVWSFDPMAEYGLSSIRVQVAAYKKLDNAARAESLGRLVTGGLVLSLPQAPYSNATGVSHAGGRRQTGQQCSRKGSPA